MHADSLESTSGREERRLGKDRPIFRFLAPTQNDTLGSMLQEHIQAASQQSPAFVLHNRVKNLQLRGEVSHIEHRLVYVVDGCLSMVHGTMIKAETGSVMVIPAGAPHQPVETQELEYWTVGFCAACYQMDEGQLLMNLFRRVRHGALPIVPILKSRRQRVLRLYRDLEEECARSARESSELVRSSLLLLLGEVSRAMPGSESRALTGSLVSNALQFIQRRCLEPISLKDVAESAHRTPAHVAFAVKKSTGHSVGEWIRAGRVAEAAARLAHTEDSLDEITYHVGWQDKTHFIRQFRKSHGMTPAAWRRQHRAKHFSDGDR